ncbi:uncharacterized protein V6R79_016387 [Siganus canaliculatus]
MWALSCQKPLIIIVKLLSFAKQKTSCEDVCFHEGCIEEAIPVTLLQFVAMLDHQISIKFWHIKDRSSNCSAASVQLLHEVQRRSCNSQTLQRQRDPIPCLHGDICLCKDKREKVVGNEIGISYDRVLEISAQLGDATVSKYVEDGVVCLTVLRKGLFTTSAMDNIDHNPTATTATASFHGTSVSAYQHPSKDKGEELRQLKFREEKEKTVPELPDSFTNVQPTFFTKKKPFPPQSGVTHLDTSVLRNWQWSTNGWRKSQ